MSANTLLMHFNFPVRTCRHASLRRTALHEGSNPAFVGSGWEDTNLEVGSIHLKPSGTTSVLPPTHTWILTRQHSHYPKIHRGISKLSNLKFHINGLYGIHFRKHVVMRDDFYDL